MTVTTQMLWSYGSAANNANTVLLNNHQGTNGSTTFTDRSVSARTLTAVANAQISTAQSVVGGSSSALFDGVGDYVTVSPTIDIPFTSVWSLGMWFRPDESTSVNASFDHLRLFSNAGSNEQIVSVFYYSTALAGRSLFGFEDAGALLQEGVSDLTAATWYYIFLKNDPSGNVFEWWVGPDGGSLTSQGTTTKRGLKMSHYGAFGNPPPNNDYKGYIGPVRVYEDFADSAVIPTALFPD